LLLFEEEQHNCSDKRSGFRYGAVRFYRDTSWVRTCPVAG
jgi:hypothetical protein